MKKSRLLGAVCAITLTWFATATSASIIYNVNRTVGAGSVTGTIETDGTIGTLDPISNITSWSLTLFDGVDSETISSTTGGMLNGGLTFLTATSTELNYNFDHANSFDVNFDLTPELQDGWFYRLEGGEEEIYHSTLEGPDHNVIVNRTGTQLIGSVVPIPAALWLFGSGLLGLVGIARKKAA